MNRKEWSINNIVAVVVAREAGIKFDTIAAYFNTSRGAICSIMNRYRYGTFYKERKQKISEALSTYLESDKIALVDRIKSNGVKKLRIKGEDTYVICYVDSNGNITNVKSTALDEQTAIDYYNKMNTTSIKLFKLVEVAVTYNIKEVR
jgi:hypothetical protein